MLIKTKITKLDNLLNGGIKSKSRVLISSPPELNSLQFLQHIVYNSLKINTKVIYITFNKKPSILKSLFKESDLEVSSFEKNKKLTIINLYEKVLDKTKLKEINNDLSNSLKKVQENSIIIIDSISSILDVYGTSKETLTFINNLIKNTKKATTLAIFTNWSYKKNITSNIRSKFNCIIDLKTIEKDIILRNYYEVSKANWVKNLKKQLVLYEVLNPGGISDFIPKLLITGPFNAGKSTFTHAISTKSTSVDRLGTTVALDYGHVSYKGYTADVFGTPGQTRFDPLLKMLRSKALGIFLVIDPSKPETFPRAKEMIIRTKASLLPTIVVSNKRASKKSLSISQIRAKLGIPKKIPVVECDALKKKGIAKAMSTLFKEMGD